MRKKYSEITDNRRNLEDPAAVSLTNDGLHALAGEEGVMTSTLSVDEYFDELIEKVRQDYAAV